MVDWYEPIEDEEETIVMPQCPACGNEWPNMLGWLGNLCWYKCGDCGIDFSTKDNVFGEVDDE